MKKHNIAVLIACMMLVLCACGSKGTTWIVGAAREPEIVDLQNFLRRFALFVICPLLHISSKE